MKTTRKLIIFVFALLAWVASAYAQSPGDELKQMVVQLQEKPYDHELREKIIKLVPTPKPAPVLPDEALRHEGCGNVFFKNAKEVADYIAAAREFEAATLAAPWIPGYYSDMCTAYEKGGVLREAAHSCLLYSMALTNEKDVQGAKLRTTGIEYETEKYSGAALQKLNGKYLPLYVNKFEFRYNNRENPDIFGVAIRAC